VCALKRGEVTQLQKCCLYDNTHLVKTPHAADRVRNFRKTGAGHHHAGGVDQAGFEGFGGSGVDGMSYPEIVGVNDQKFGAARVAEFFRQSLGISCAHAAMGMTTNSRKRFVRIRNFDMDDIHVNFSILKLRSRGTANRYALR
jgi:hypothetical protein